MSRAFPVLAVAVAGAVLAACQTTQAPAPIPRFTGWTPIERADSEVSFVGDRGPEIIRTRMRWIRGRVRDEELFLASDTPERNLSTVRVQLASTGFTQAASEEFDDPERLETGARWPACRGAERGSAQTATNPNGRFLYLVCRYPNGDRCIFARQGIRNVAPESGETHYFALAEWLFCSASLDEKEILGMFASLRVKGAGK